MYGYRGSTITVSQCDTEQIRYTFIKKCIISEINRYSVIINIQSCSRAYCKNIQNIRV